MVVQKKHAAQQHHRDDGRRAQKEEEPFQNQHEDDCHFSEKIWFAMAMADAESTAPVNEPSGVDVMVQELSVAAMMSAMNVFMLVLLG
jgi:hypothetical protein